MFVLSPPPSLVCRRELLQISFRKPHRSAENKHINFYNNVFKTMCPWNKNLNFDKYIELYNIRKKTWVPGHAFLTDTCLLCCYRQKTKIKISSVISLGKQKKKKFPTLV